jgi:hypothetical protein
MSADVVITLLAGCLTGTALAVALAGWLFYLLVNGDNKPSRNGAKTAKQKWWLR